MKLTLQHFAIRSTDTLDAWIENQMFSLQPRLQIEEAIVRLDCRFEQSPAFTARVHLVVPGPDLFVEGRDHTVRAAFGKAMQRLNGQIANRFHKSRQKVRSNLSSPAAKARSLPTR